MKKVLVLVIIALYAIACKNNKPEGFYLEGKIEGLKDEKVLLQTQGKDGSLKVLDSAKIDASGAFVLKGKVTSPEMYLLIIGTQHTPIPVFVENNEMKLTGKKDELPNVKITGSETQKTLDDFIATSKKYDAKTKDFKMRFQQAHIERDTAKMEAINKEYEELEKGMMEDACSWVKSHASSVVAIYLANQISIRCSFQQIDGMAKAFVDDQVKNSEYGKDFFAMYENLKKIQVGGVAPDFTLQTKDDKSIALSSLKNKVVLVDFWASWCKPCIKKMPDIAKLYAKFKGKNFEILGVSVDHDNRDWKKAMTDNKMTWLQVLDNKGDIAKLYGLKSIPHTVLLDKEGKIVATNLENAELSSKIAELIK